MKKVLFVLMALCFMSSLAFAQEATEPAAANVAAPIPDPIGLDGYIIDNASMRANRDNLDKFLKTYTKEVALATENVNSGYSIFANNQGYPLDKESCAKVVEFLKNPDSKLQVRVSAKQAGDALSVSSFINQE